MPLVDQGYRTDDKEHLYRIDDHHRFVVIEAECQQAMMHMVAAGTEPIHSSILTLVILQRMTSKRSFMSGSNRRGADNFRKQASAL